MNEYNLLESVLSGIFSSSVGYDEDEAKDELKNDLNTNSDFKNNFEVELKKAFADPELSWKLLFEKFDVCYFENESEAEKYAVEVLWDITFGDKIPPIKNHA